MRQSPGDVRPERRFLRIYTFDPMLARGGDHRATVDIAYRELHHEPGRFFDDRLEVVDYDGATKRYYKALRLDAPGVAVQQGVEPSEADPQFHQQMVYAVASRVLETVDRALGRRLRFSGGRPLRLFPHAFQVPNAYYDDQLGVLFGYFAADADDPGANLPGQTIFTCLSHDIVAHEVAHAVLDRLRPHYANPTNPQVPAFHEAFADLVAVFLRFTIPDVVRDVVRRTRGDLLGRPNAVREIGAQFGAAVGLGAPLRDAGTKPDPAALSRTTRPHALGRILVSAVFEGFVRTFERRTLDLIRIATGGSGRLPEGELHPDLVGRLATECTRTAQAVLSMCIRATDYLPAVDVTFSDFLRAMVTADYELNRDDASGLRAAMIEAFRVRGIRPEAVGSYAVESLLLPALDADPAAQPSDAALARLVERAVTLGAREMSRNTAPLPAVERTFRHASTRRVKDARDLVRQQQADIASKDASEDAGSEEDPASEWSHIARELHAWAKGRLGFLGLEDGVPLRVVGFHPVHRVAPSGELLVEMVAQLVQTQPTPEDLGGLRWLAGVTLVATLEGRVRYRVAKPFTEGRLDALRRWVRQFDASTAPRWTDEPRDPERIVRAFSLRAIHGARRR
jgi:hypothetical protein